MNIAALMAEVRRLRTDVMTAVREEISTRLVGWTDTARSSSMGDTDMVQTADDDQGQRPVQRIEPFGLRSRPVARLRSLWLRLGASNVVFIGIAPTKGYGPGDLDDGEVAIYNASKALVRLWRAGKLTIDAQAGQDVVVNGGTLNVARKTDKVIADAGMTTWMSQVAAAINGLVTGAVAPPAPVDFGVINGGAPNFKA